MLTLIVLEKAISQKVTRQSASVQLLETLWQLGANPPWSEKEWEAVHRIVNDFRKFLGTAPLSPRKRKALRADFNTLARSRAMRVAAFLSKKLTPAQKKALLRKVLNSPPLLATAAINPAADECLDRVIDLNEKEIKRFFSKNPKALNHAYRKEEIYLSSTPDDLYSPYPQLIRLLKKLDPKPGQHVVDLGSGLGRMGIIVGIKYPQVHFTGFELMRERHDQGQRAVRTLGLQKKVDLQNRDLSDPKFVLPPADYYFMFNPFSGPTLRKILSRLHKMSLQKKFTLVAVNIGRPPRQLNKFSWLKLTWDSGIDPIWPGRGFLVYQTR